MNLSYFAEGDVPRSIRRIICLSIMLDHPNVCCLDSDNEVRKFMIVQREMLSWLKRYFPHPHEVVLEENPITDRTVLLIWFHLLGPLMLLSDKLRLTCMLSFQSLFKIPQTNALVQYTTLTADPSTFSREALHLEAGQSHLIIGTASTSDVTTSQHSKLRRINVHHKALENLDAIALLLEGEAIDIHKLANV